MNEPSVRSPQWFYGYSEPSPRGMKTAEFSASVLSFAPNESIKRRGFNRRLANILGKQIVEGYYSLEEIATAAPKAKLRLFKEVPCDYGVRVGSQLDRCVERIREDSDTRRAIIVLGHPDDDTPCCIQEIQFLVRDKKLLTVAYMRAWDSFLGLPYDITMFRALQRHVADSLRLEVGNVVVMTASYHKYLEELRNENQE
jgi:hypothetical protein